MIMLASKAASGQLFKSDKWLHIFGFEPRISLLRDPSSTKAIKPSQWVGGMAVIIDDLAPAARQHLVNYSSLINDHIYLVLNLESPGYETTTVPLNHHSSSMSQSYGGNNWWSCPGGGKTASGQLFKSDEWPHLLGFEPKISWLWDHCCFTEPLNLLNESVLWL